MAFATEEARHSPKMKRILVTHAAELEAVSDGIFVYMHAHVHVQCHICICTVCTSTCKPAGYKLLLEMVHLVEIVGTLVVPRSKLSIVHRFFCK